MENQHVDSEEIIDVEQYSKDGKEIPSGKKYNIRIDKTHYIVSQSEMTGREILTLASKVPPERFALYQKLKGGEAVKTELDQVVDFRTPGVERFMTLPLDQTEGAELAATWEPRMHFDLPEEDSAFLEKLALPWEAITVEPVKRIVIYGYSLPKGYNQTHVDLNVRIEKNYPDTQIDMVYFSPAISRNDGKPIKSASDEIFDEKCWQRWSRHRTPQNPWRPGIDGLESHLMLIGEWLTMELIKD